MTSLVYQIDEKNMGDSLLKIFDDAEADIKASEPIFELAGTRLETAMITLPKHQAFYASRAKELKAVVEWLEISQGKAEAVCFKNYSRGQKVLSTSDQRNLIGGEPAVVEIKQLVVTAQELVNKLNEIVNAMQQMGFMLSNVTKLRIAELNEYVL